MKKAKKQTTTQTEAEPVNKIWPDSNIQTMTQSNNTPRLKMDPLRHEVFLDGNRVHVCTKSYLMLSALCQTNQTMSREELTAAAWPHDKQAKVEARTIDQHIRRLRVALGDPGLVETVPGFGYRMAPGAV